MLRAKDAGQRWWRGCLTLAVASSVLSPVAAELPSCNERPPVYDGQSGRVVRGTAGFGALMEHYFAVLPEAYAEDDPRRYPVVYLLHGALSSPDEYLVCMNLLELSASSAPVIVVIPEGTGNGFWIDWHNGRQLRERALIETLLPHIDETFRTIADKEHRAIAGLSMGGYGAMVQGARHPELFGAAASFSGVVGVSEPELPFAAVAWAGTSLTSPGAFANPVTGKMWRRQHDPAALVEQLRTLNLFLSSGNGIPCSLDEARRFAEPDPTQPTAEPLVRLNQQILHEALLGAEIPHTYREYDCGAHTHVTFQRELEEAWPQILNAIGAAPFSADDFSALR